MHAELVIKNAAQLVTPIMDLQIPSMDDGVGGLLVLENGALAARDGFVIAIGRTPDIESSIEHDASTDVIDAGGKTVLPGFVDPHTHPVFAATREDEFELRTQGKTYKEIAKAGGGILSSVHHLREASKEELVESALPRLDRFLANGTTTIEAKSGYGLSVEDELKSLEVIRELNGLHPVELIPTLLGAHEVPEEYRSRREEYIRLVIEEMIPRTAEEGLAEFGDVFCEEGVFSIEESRRILEAGKEHGLAPKIHANQLTESGGAELAAELGAVSADHLDHTGSRGISAMSEAGVVPVLLPGAVFFLGLEKYAPARQMIEAGLPVALATDMNPGTCMTESMPMMMTLACVKMRMMPAEALVASTLNAAAAVQRSSSLGHLSVGAQADCVIWDMPNYRHLAYHFAVELAEVVVKKGKVVWTRSIGHRAN